MSNTRCELLNWLLVLLAAIVLAVATIPLGVLERYLLWTYLLVVLAAHLHYGICVVSSLKPIFHWKWGLRWVPNTNEIYTKNMKYTWPTPAFCVGTQRNLYSTDWCRGLALGLTQILGLASGKANFHILDTNMLVSPTQNSGVGGIAQEHFMTSLSIL